MNKENESMIPVVVTTLHKGVFFGYATKTETEAKTITLLNARMCIYWCEQLKGIFGLIAKGPLQGCRISPTVPKITLQDVTSIAIVSPESEQAWKEFIW